MKCFGIHNKSKIITILVLFILFNSCDNNDRSKDLKIKPKVITWSIYNMVEDKKVLIGELKQFIDNKQVIINFKNNLIEDPRFPNDTNFVKQINYDLFESLFIIDTNYNTKRPIFLKDTTNLNSKFNPYINYLFLSKLHNIIVYVDLFHNIKVDPQIGVYEFMISGEGLILTLNDVSYINKKQNKFISEFVNSISKCDTCQLNIDTNYIRYNFGV